MADQFARTELLLGPEAMDALARAHVAVFGIGGVGGYAIEALARCGVGQLDIVDNDTVSLTNLNRQVIATHETIGKEKAEVMAQRIAAINPSCTVRARTCFYLPQTASEFDFSGYSYIVDAVDTVTAKLRLVEEAVRCGTPIVSSMGAANRLDPTAFAVGDIYETSVDPLARIMRKECRKRGIESLKVVYSTEAPLRPLEEPDPEELAENPGRRSIPGSVSFVPPAAGLALASVVVRDLTG